MFCFTLQNIMYVMLSIGSMFMSHETGERLGYTISLLIAVEVTKLYVNQLLPVCGETLWISFWNFMHLM